MKIFLASLCLLTTIAAQAANFPYISLNNKTNRISDNGTAPTYNGVAIGGGGSAPVGTVVNTGASTIGAVPSYSDASGTNVAPSTVTITSNTLFAPIIAAGQIQVYQDTITHAGSVVIDFSSTNAHYLALTGNVTFVTLNLATNRTARFKILGTTTNSTPAFPSWHFVGGSPTVITANKFSMLSLEAWGSNDTNVFAAFSEEQ